MSSKPKISYILLKILSFLLVLSGLFSLFGAFSITGIGTKLYSFYKLILGTYAWVGPFLCFALSVVLWPGHKSNRKKQGEAKYQIKRSKNKIKTKQEQVSNKKVKVDKNKDNVTEPLSNIPLPSTKLVSLKGFEQYFNSTEWVDETSSTMESIPELGRDFPTYFGEGQEFPFKIPPKLTSLHGLKEYFETVDQELTDDANDRIESNRHYAGQVAQLVNRTNESLHQSFSSDGVTPLERDVLLGNKNFFKEMEEHKKIGKFEQENKQQIKNLSNIKPDDFKEPEDSIEKKTPELNRSSEIVTNSDHRFSQEYTDKQNIKNEPDEIQQKEEFFEKYQNVDRRENTGWILPPIELLDPLIEIPIIQEQETPKRLETVLQDFGVKAKVIRITKGPVITRFELAPAPGVKISKIVNLADDIALALAARDVRIEAPIPGKSAIGIEVPNKITRSVPFREVMETREYLDKKSNLKLALGKDIADQPVIADLVKMPHLLVAGATGSGKSVCITALINSILFNANPDEVKFLLVDPKMVELTLYNGIPHLLAPVVTDPQKATAALKWVVKEMETRYQLFAANGVRDIERYNKMKLQENPDTKSVLPLITVVIDELADLMLVASGDVEEAICRLAQMARAAGIHLIIATQRPSVDVITGLIKANIPSRISFAVTSQIDSRTILDTTGAEKLLGKGDMLFSPQGINKPVRIQGCFVADEEVNKIIEHWKKQGQPAYLDPEHLFNTTVKQEDNTGPEDELFLDAGQLLISSGMASVSFLQRKFKLGYARAARLMDMFEEQGIVGAYEGSKPRQILITIEEFNQRFVKN